MALSNLKDTITTNTFQWINQFWQPILALGAGIMEETWMRLFIIVFIYALISSKTTKKYIPEITALLISSVFFGFGHSNYISIQNCFNITILYGFPMGVLLIKRDFETAIGYHFMIDFIGAIGALVFPL
jgi:membrane protease YdiL (CAAX protease family)